jgi:hypothetical protein
VNLEDNTKDPNVIVRLKSHWMIWFSLALVVLPIGVGMSMVGLVSLAANTTLAERLGLGALCGVVGAWALLFGIRALRLGRARPRVLVKMDELVIEHAGLLQKPVVIPRSEVESVCIGDFIKPRRARPRAAGKGPVGRVLAYSRWLDSGDQFPQFTASAVLPDLSFPLYYPLAGPFSNVLIVLRRPFALGRIPRRGLGILTDEGSVYRGPTRGARIRGLLAAAMDVDEARRAFVSWGVTQEAPTEEMVAWVSPSRTRRRAH